MSSRTSKGRAGERIGFGREAITNGSSRYIFVSMGDS